MVSLVRELAERGEARVPIPRRAFTGFLTCSRPWTVSKTIAVSDNSVPSLTGSSSSDALGRDSGNPKSNELRKGFPSRNKSTAR